MQKRSFVYYFLILLVLSFLIFGASKIGLLNPLDSFFKNLFSPFSETTYSIFAKLTDFSANSQIQSLKAQNLVLANKLVDQSKLIADNKALRDQFETETPKSQNLLPADVEARRDLSRDFPCRRQSFSIEEQKTGSKLAMR